MELSAEEKKAIEWLKKSEFFSARLYGPIILNLIKKQQNEIKHQRQQRKYWRGNFYKQQEEIEKLNFENHMIKKWNKQLDKNCISKYKIREKIEHYNDELEHIKNGEEFENEKPMYYWSKVALENLLEEN